MQRDLVLPLGTVHPEIFHYTTRSGLEGILKSDTLWATNYLHLNDRTEIVLIIELLKERLLPTAKEVLTAQVFDGKLQMSAFKGLGGYEKLAASLTSAFVDASFEALHNELYITSFCGTSQDEYVRRNGLLSQWRGYGQSGGFCLEFDTKRLVARLIAEGKRYEGLVGHAADVIYSDSEDRFNREFRQSFKDAQEYFKELAATLLEPSRQAPDAKAFLPSFLNVITRYKHRAFKEEQEVRIFCGRTRIDAAYRKAAAAENYKLLPEKPLHDRMAGATKVPYVKLFETPDGPLPITRIIVGPQPKQKEVSEEIAALGEPLNIAVELSDIPYVTR